MNQAAFRSGVDASDEGRNLAVNVYALPTIGIKQSMTTICRQGVWFILALLLASSSARTQTSLSSLQPGQPLPKTDSVNAGRGSKGERPTGYVNGASSCDKRTGDKDCPFRKIGEGVGGISSGGTLFIRGGSYGEPIVLNKKMAIRAYDGSVTINPSSPKPFDLVADTVDINLLPLNPRWGAQTKGGAGLPDAKSCGLLRGLTCAPLVDLPCANQVTYLDCATTHLICIGPHVNWFGATYEGWLYWENKSPTLPSGDDDYNVRLVRDDKAAYTVTNPDHLLLEFDSDETIDHFTTTWWSEFHKAVDDSDAKARPMIDGRFAIVTGLIGLDCQPHDITGSASECHSESHPVWALAMNVQPSIDDDLWAFFVRNWGNEGFCGTSQHFLDLPNNKYTFRLPWRSGATSVKVSSKLFRGYHTTKPEPTVRPVPDEGVFVTFTLDAPREDGSMWDGELHLEWSGAGIRVQPSRKRPHFVDEK